jgi:hypothetical protein
MWYSQAGHRRQYGACALHASAIRLETHTHTEYVTFTACLVYFHNVRRRTEPKRHAALRLAPAQVPVFKGSEPRGQ